MPPLVGVAVKLTWFPEQAGFEEAAIETLTGILELTTMVTALDVAGLPVAQVAFEVSMQVTTSLLTGVYENRELFVPAGLLFTFH